MIIGLSEKYDSKQFALMAKGETNCEIDIKSIVLHKERLTD